MRVLVTGATGYIGGRLVPLLLARGHTVRVLVRDASRVTGHSWSDDVEVMEGDVTVPASLAGCCDGMDAAYYLVHSMTSRKDFRAVDAAAAEAFAQEARGVHIVYLGGLQPQGEASDHLASRAEVGAVLAAHAPTTEFRAGPVIGSGSASFEMTRYLTERLPVMVTPKWVRNEVQPIAVRDVLAYLVAALDEGPSGIVDVGGDRLPFRDMMRVYGEVRGLRRLIVPVPVLAPTLAARWVQFITPITNRIAVPLLAGIVHPVTADTTRARKLFPDIQPMGYREAVELAIEREALDDVETRWSGAAGDAPRGRLEDWENMKREVRSRHTHKSPEAVFAVIESLGGRTGWLHMDWAWKLRGAMDRAVGGPGLRRGRRSASRLRAGDAVDFWRVEAIEPGRLLRLRAEMRLPGRAWLQFEVLPEDGGCRVIQTALFEPRGLPGVLYWNSLIPMHALIHGGMLRKVIRRADG